MKTSSHSATQKIRQALIEARKCKGMSQQEFAKEIGITRAFFANLELGNYDPSLKVAHKIARFCGRKIEDLFPPPDDLFPMNPSLLLSQPENEIPSLCER